MATSNPSLRIVVTQGHRNTSGGNPAEAARTPAIANAVCAALKAADHDAIALQNEDGTADNWFSGSLDAVARRVMTYHRKRAVDLLLDIHLEGDPANTRGVFAIVPDGDGLATLTPYSGSDRSLPTGRDYRFAVAIAREVARITGLPLRSRTVIGPGVMSERQTHVGSDLGWRLAMFGYTAPARQRMARLVLECGNIVSDGAIIRRSDFPNLVAAGVVAGIAEAIGAVPAVPEVDTPDWPPFGTARILQAPRRVRIAVDGLRARKYAETSQPILATWSRGEEVPVCGWIVGEAVDGNPIWWLTGEGKRDDRRWRVWSGGTNLAGATILRLPTRPS